MKKQTHIVALILLTTALIFNGCGGPSTADPEQKKDSETLHTELSETMSEIETELQTETEAPVDYTNLVTDALNEELEVTVYGNASECSYRIPVINWDGDEIAALNEQIYEKYSAYYTNTKENGESGWYKCNECSYTWCVNDDILTLVLTASLYPDASGWLEPEVFSVDLKESKVMDKEAVMDYFELNAETYNQKVKDAMGNQFCKLYEGAFENNSSYFYESFTQEQLARTISQENIDFAVPYINEEGHLGIRARIYSLAAGDSYPHLVDVETIEISKWYVGGSTDNDSLTDDYIIADSNSRYLDASDIANLSSDQIQMAVNEIYARHGRKFMDDSVRAYFESKSWYSGTVEPEQFDISVFNKYETANLEYLLSHK